MNELIGYGGLSKQTGKGVAASSPATFGFGVLGGKLFDLAIEQEYEEMTLNGGAYDRFAPAIHRTGAQPGANFRTRAHMRTIGAFLLGVLGSDSVAGTNP